MRSTAVPYQPGSTSEHWSAALELIDPETQGWMQLRVGHAATAHQPLDDKLLLLIGAGDNGKTTIVDAVVTALGDYAAQVSDQVLTAGEGDHPTEQMDLMGLRLAIMEELPGGRYVNVGRLKKVVGTKSTTARRMHQDPVTFRNTHSLIVTSNYQPKIVETDNATWRRLLCVPFPLRYVDGDPLEPNERRKRPEIRETLRAGDPAVLAWIVEEAQRALTDRQPYQKAPAAVAALTEKVRIDNNAIMEFFAERTTAGEFAPSLLLYETYADWMKARGRQAPPIEVFSERVHEALGLERVRRRWQGRQVMGYPGIELTLFPADIQIEDSSFLSPLDPPYDIAPSEQGADAPVVRSTPRRPGHKTSCLLILGP